MHKLTMVLNLHREGDYAAVSIASLMRAVGHARDVGREVGVACALDQPDEYTLQAVETSEADWEFVEIFDHADLGLTRNDAVAMADGDAIGFMDGDDLCGRSWIASALDRLDGAHAPAVYHPEYVYYFDESDFLCHSTSTIPNAGAKSFWFKHVDSSDPFFDVNVIRFNNVYTSNVISPRSLFDAHPLRAADSSTGFGIEDWTWNAVTLAKGVEHVVVPETVHMVRIKSMNSLGQLNSSKRLLPELTIVFPPRGEP